MLVRTNPRDCDPISIRGHPWPSASTYGVWLNYRISDLIETGKNHIFVGGMPRETCARIVVHSSGRLLEFVLVPSKGDAKIPL